MDDFGKKRTNHFSTLMEIPTHWH